MLNRVILMGRLVADPELRQTPSNVSVASFRIAVDRNYQRQGEEKQADFISVVAWRQTADFVGRYFTKGRMIVVEGSLRTGSYTDQQGNKRYTTEVYADNVYFGDSKPAQGASPVGASPYGNAPQTASRPQPPAFQEPEKGTAFSVGDIGDFEQIDDDGDLPF